MEPASTSPTHDVSPSHMSRSTLKEMWERFSSTGSFHEQKENATSQQVGLPPRARPLARAETAPMSKWASATPTGAAWWPALGARPTEEAEETSKAHGMQAEPDGQAEGELTPDFEHEPPHSASSAGPPGSPASMASPPRLPARWSMPALPTWADTPTPVKVEVTAVEAGRTRVGTARPGSYTIKPTCIAVLPPDACGPHEAASSHHEPAPSPAASPRRSLFEGTPRKSREMVDTPTRDVFQAQFAQLAMIEAQADREEEEELEAVEEANRATRAARARKEAALQRIADARATQEATEKEAAILEKEEVARAAASRREQARERARASARAVGQRLAASSGNPAPLPSPALQRARGGKDKDDGGLTRSESMLHRTRSLRAGAAAGAQRTAAAVGRIRQKTASAFDNVSEVGSSAFGFALGLRDGYKKTLTFSLMREDTTPEPTKGDGKGGEPPKRPPMSIRCPCTACGHLNKAVIDDSQINKGDGDGKSSVRIRCTSCSADLVVKVTKRDPRLSI